jgi:hypothetical protein
MRRFHELIFDRYCENAGFFSPIQAYNYLFGYVHTLRFIIVADVVSGGSPTLTIPVYETGNAQQANVIKELLSLAPLAANASNIFSASVAATDAAYPPAKYLVPVVVLGGTDPKAHVRIWATGRAPYAVPQAPTPRTFGDELEQARAATMALKRPVDELVWLSPKDLLP